MSTVTHSIVWTEFILSDGVNFQFNYFFKCNIHLHFPNSSMLFHESHPLLHIFVKSPFILTYLQWNRVECSSLILGCFGLGVNSLQSVLPCSRLQSMKQCRFINYEGMQEGLNFFFKKIICSWWNGAFSSTADCRRL